MNIDPQYGELLSRFLYLLQNKICSYIASTRYIEPEWKKEFYELYSSMSLIEHNSLNAKFTHSCKELAYTLMQKPTIPATRSKSKHHEKRNLKNAHKRGKSENRYYNQLMTNILHKKPRQATKDDRDFWLTEKKIEFLR